MINPIKMTTHQRICVWSVLSILIIITGASGVSLEQDLTLSHKERLILDKFRKSVEFDLPHEYMKKDIYLVRWLRARNFDINLARMMLFENLEWRRKNRMDTIHEEDWYDYSRRYKFWVDGVDKEGRPIAFLNIGSWDLRRAVVSGESQKLVRYIDKCVDQAVGKVRRWQDEGRNITQLNFIVNLGGFSVTQQGCLQCIPFYVSFVSTYEQRYPGAADKIFLVNTPSVFEVVLSAVRPIFSPGTRDALKEFGPNRNQYSAIIFRDIDKDQLPPEVGGTDDGTIYEDLYDTNGII